jgi:hypothetical protein
MLVRIQSPTAKEQPMESQEAEVRELKPRQEARVSSGAEGEKSELVSSERDLNRDAVQRIAVNEGARCLPELRRAVEEARLGQQLRQMAAFAGASEIEGELREALEELATAAKT